MAEWQNILEQRMTEHLKIWSALLYGTKVSQKWNCNELRLEGTIKSSIV